jgi:hypothetical protein
VASRQNLSPTIGSFDHDVRFAPMTLTPDDLDELTKQRVVCRRNPNPFNLTGSYLINLLAIV